MESSRTLLLCILVPSVFCLVPPIAWSEYDVRPNGDQWLLSRHKRDSEDIRPSCKPNAVVPPNRADTSDRLRRLRLRMKASGYSAYIIPTNDAHQSEYVSEYDGRRAYISGFSGSQGEAVVLLDNAALWTDGRYFLQAEAELDCNWIIMKKFEKGTPSIEDWLSEKLQPGANLGSDPRLITHKGWLKWEEKFNASGIKLTGGFENLVDDIWTPVERPPESIDPVFIHDLKYAGKSWQEKVNDVRKELKKRKIDGVIITALDDVAWLFNLRGNDVPHTPVFKAYALVSVENIRLYIKQNKLTNEVRKYLSNDNCNSSNCVQVKNYNETYQDLGKSMNMFSKILISSSSSYAIYNLIPQNKREVDTFSIIQKMKTVKNPTEIQGMKNSHIRDSVAIIDFMAMLEEEVKAGRHWDEIKASEKVLEYRREQNLNKGASFDSISASGSNGAIIHYSAKPKTNKTIDTKHIYLLDSGGQYLDGTTDITRTFHFGNPTEFEKEAYTRVLMGVIDLMTTVFSEDIRDADLDIIARKPLYEVGLNYLHGTGHGLGHFLGVHEGPNAIRDPAISKNPLPLRPGIFLSDEPGYYESGKFGIRLETTIMVTEAKTVYKFNDKKYYTFEPIALVPFEPNLMKLDLLSRKQKKWLNEYNEKIISTVGRQLQLQRREKGLKWMLQRTKYIYDDYTCGAITYTPSVYTVTVLVIFLLVINLNFIFT